MAFSSPCLACEFTKVQNPNIIVLLPVQDSLSTSLTFLKPPLTAPIVRHPFTTQKLIPTYPAPLTPPLAPNSPRSSLRASTLRKTVLGSPVCPRNTVPPSHSSPGTRTSSPCTRRSRALSSLSSMTLRPSWSMQPCPPRRRPSAHLQRLQQRSRSQVAHLRPPRG